MNKKVTCIAEELWDDDRTVGCVNMPLIEVPVKLQHNIVRLPSQEATVQILYIGTLRLHSVGEGCLFCRVHYPLKIQTSFILADLI